MYQEACNKLNNHGIIAFPTETVMGLAIVFDDFEAYQKLNKVKLREPDKPYSMMIANVDDISKFAYVNPEAQKCINKYLPGSLTLLLKVRPNVPKWVTCNSGIIGIRVPSNDEARQLLKEIGKPLLVPSANKAGEKPCMSSDEVNEVFGQEIDYVIKGKAISGIPTTIVSFVDEIKLIREGSITLSDIIKTIKEGVL